MRWRGGRRSDNVEDRRGSGGTGMPGGMRFPGGGMGSGGRRAGVGGFGLIAVIVLAVIFGIDPSQLLRNSPTGGTTSTLSEAEQAKLKEFVSVVLADTEDTWIGLFRQQGDSYREPRLVLFTGSVDSGCGHAQAAMGPFYCPGDRKVYLDLDFFHELASRFQAPGDFAGAYVVAHEVGHHVQNLMGVMAAVNERRTRVSEAESNALSVRVELQADCLAGVWAYHAGNARDLLEAGDVEEGLRAAAAVGDDALQQQSQGYVVPDSFTHGSSEQRVRWFKQGLASGTVAGCDTFDGNLM